MQAFTKIDGLVLPLDKANVDTDQIIPKQYLKSIKRTGFGPTLFDDWRYLDSGEPGMDHTQRAINPDFVLNDARFKGAQVLLTRENFGCGSSREHAPWAIEDYGFRVIISPSYADIFYNNCFNNGLLPIILDDAIIDDLFQQVEANEGYRLTVDLETQQITTPNGDSIAFDIDPLRKTRLINGLDEVGVTLQYADEIKAFEAKRKVSSPWLY